MDASFRSIGRRLTLRLFGLSIICWWVVGFTFSALWWLTNAYQLAWIIFCYAWEVPLVGWTGVVLIPWLRWRAIGRALSANDPRSVRQLSRYPQFLGTCAIATSSVGYAIGAVQLIVFAHMPWVESLKMCVQGVLLGAVLGAAVALEAERATRAVALGDALRSVATSDPIRHTLATKIRYFTIVIALGAALPILLFSLSLEQRRLEETRGIALSHELATRPTVGALPAFGPHTSVFATGPVPRNAATIAVGDVVIDADRSLSADTAGWFASRFDGHRVVAFRREAGGLLVAVSPLADYSQGLVTTLVQVGSVCLVALVIAYLLALSFARSLVEPLQRLQHAAAEMAEGKRDVGAVAALGGDEVAALTRRFDAMAARVREDEASLRAAQDQLVQSEKLSAVGRVVSGIAHELNNPLTAILHFADNLLSESGHSAGDREMLQSVGTQARRARAIVRDLLSFVRARTHPQEAADIHDVIRDAARAVAPAVAEAGAAFVLAGDTGVPLVRIDALGIEQVLTNIIVNGAQAAGAGGVVGVSVSVDGDRVHLSVADSGPGIPPEVMPRIFEPFFTTKGPGKGTGLGLAVSTGVVQQHGGRLTAENRPGGGAIFTLDVPVHPDQAAAAIALRDRRERLAREEAAARAARAAQENGARGPRETVMVIDDEEPIRTALRLFLERSGWAVEEASSGHVALATLLSAPADSYRAVITDLTMPDMTGMQIHDTLAAMRPDLWSRLIIATGETVSDAVVSFRARSGRPFLEKPFEFDALGDILAQMPGATSHARDMA